MDHGVADVQEQQVVVVGAGGRVRAVLRHPHRGLLQMLAAGAAIWTVVLVELLTGRQWLPSMRALAVAGSAFMLVLALTILSWAVRSPSRRSVLPPARLFDDMAAMVLASGVVFVFAGGLTNFSALDWYVLIFWGGWGGVAAGRTMLSAVVAVGGAEAVVAEESRDPSWRAVRGARGWE